MQMDIDHTVAIVKPTVSETQQRCILILLFFVPTLLEGVAECVLTIPSR